ncbi:MAG: hypothetical protein LJE57_00100 [Gallionella sp.]|nr:hypothetical protein [Gallionella sp.]
MAKRYLFMILLSLFSGLSNTQAADIYHPSVTLSGFSTVGLSHSTMHYGDYTLDSTIPKGPGLSEDWSASNDTRIAGQVAIELNPKISAVLQVISKYHVPNTYHPEVEWANVKYAFTPDAFIRVGRIALPTFLNSDSRNVGYSYVWTHPPLELYRQLYITQSDGVDATYHVDILAAMNSIRAIVYGKNTLERQNSISTSKDIWGIFDTIEYGPMTAHIGYQERFSFSENIQTGISGDWVKYSDLTVGMEYDPGDWFAVTEWIQRKSIYKISAMYVSGGYRINEFTPYLTYSQSNQGSFLPGFPPPSSNIIRLANRSQSTASLGVRWDFLKNTDFKFQYDQIKLSDASNGFLANVPPNITLYGAKFHVISAVFDLIF